MVHGTDVWGKKNSYDLSCRSDEINKRQSQTVPCAYSLSFPVNTEILNIWKKVSKLLPRICNDMETCIKKHNTEPTDKGEGRKVIAMKRFEF
jgi:hypothetical protein